jgi:hypothetical protein
MAPNFLLTEQVVRQDGNGPTLAVGGSSQKAFYLSLGITRVLEQQSLDLSIWGSPDGENWGAKPLAAFPQKFYCGVYSLLLDLTSHPDIQYLRVAWKVSRWGRGEPTPLFSIYVFAEPAAERQHTQAAVA